MSFNIKSSFVSRAVVEDDKQVDTGKEEEVVIQEQYDGRTLFERLQEQKTLKEEKFAEDSRLSNQIKRVDEEEAEFFRILSDEKEKLEYERKIKEKLELEEYRQAVEARSIPAPPPLVAITKPIIKSTAKSSNNNNKVKGALFIKKKKKRDGNSSEEEEKEAVNTKKQKTSLSLLSDTYGDISSSDSD